MYIDASKKDMTRNRVRRIELTELKYSSLIGTYQKKRVSSVLSIADTELNC